MRLSLYSPNGQLGCLWIHLGRFFDLTLGLRPALLGFDITWRGRMIFAIPASAMMRHEGD